MELRGWYRRSGLSRRSRALAAGAVAFAIAGIVLLRSASDAGAIPIEPVDEPVAADARPTRSPFAGPLLTGHLAVSQSAVATGSSKTLFAELLFQAGELDAMAEAPPIAMAVVLDVSGSMMGEKIEQAKRSVEQLIRRMRPTDGLALVTYSDKAQTLHPLSEVGPNRARLVSLVQAVSAGGGTNIPAGLDHGVRELSMADTPVRRLVLVSDGLDNSGQPLPTIAATVRSRAESGLVLSALGIGLDYDERYLTTLADAGRGNYEFLLTGTELHAFLDRELTETVRTVVDRITADVRLPAGLTLVRTFGGEATADAGGARIMVGSLAAGEKRQVILELLASPGAAGSTLAPLASSVQYRVVSTEASQVVAPSPLALAVVSSESEALRSRDGEIYAQGVAVQVAEKQNEAIAAYERGDADRAVAIAQQNAARLQAVLPYARAKGAKKKLEALEADAEMFKEAPSESRQGRTRARKVRARNFDSLAGVDGL